MKPETGGHEHLSATAVAAAQDHARAPVGLAASPAPRGPRHLLGDSV